MRGKTISLDKFGNVYILDNNQLAPIIPSGSVRQLTNDPYSHFFHTPFTSISYIIENKVMDTFLSHPSSYYPGSPFDVFDSIRFYLEDDTLIFPRFYLYPSSSCNSKCIICPFSFRHKTPRFMPVKTIERIAEFMDLQTPRPKTLSVIISGDGEPSLHPSFCNLMDIFSKRKTKIFLSSNFILPDLNKLNVIKKIADTVSILTISMKGLSEDSYDKYQGMHSSEKGFNRVLNNIELLMEELSKNNRRNDVLVGIASLILPENTNHYNSMIKRFLNFGLDYVYLNVVEPSYKEWNIDFNDYLKEKTISELSKLNRFSSKGIIIRYSIDLFKGTTGQTVWYDARSRNNIDICGSALWNPLFMSNDDHTSVIACRSSDKFTNNSYWFNDDIETCDSIITKGNYQKVMNNAMLCEECRVERQVRVYDELIRIERQYSCKGKFVLNFNESVLNKSGGVLKFEDTFKRGVNYEFK